MLRAFDSLLAHPRHRPLVAVQRRGMTTAARTLAEIDTDLIQASLILRALVMPSSRAEAWHTIDALLEERQKARRRRKVVTGRS